MNKINNLERYYAEDFHDTSLQAARAKTGLVNNEDDIQGAGCFVAGTKVFTSLGWKPIEKIKVGAIVIAYDAHGNIEHGYVRETHKHTKTEQKHSIIKLTLANDIVLEVTANHGMWQDNGETPFVEAKTLRVGDTLFDINGDPVEIVGRKTSSLNSQADDFCSYNLIVHPQHTYIVEGIRVHNGGGDKSGDQRTPVESPNTLRSRSVARIQEVISEGEVEGLVDDGRSLFFDDTPILNLDDSPNFEDVSFFFFNGYPDQDVMPGFSDVEAEQVVNIEMQAGSSGVVQTLPAGTDAARVTVQLPAGLYNTDTTTGDIRGHTVNIEIETRLSGGIWESQMDDDIVGKTMSVYERDYRIDAPQPYDGLTSWEVRASRNSPVDAKVTTKSVTYFARVTEIQEIEIAYEDTCIAGVTVDAKSTGGNVPIRSYDIKGIKVQIPTNYDPITRVYTGSWSGQFKIEWTDNPAWIVYDLITSTRYGLGDKIDAATIDKFSFYDAAVYNDELVDDGDGGTEPRFTFNTQLAVQEDSWKIVQAVASSMRATVLPATIITLLQDRPAPVAKIINNANTIDGLFNYTGTPRAARKTVAHVTYNEPIDRYLPRTITEEDSTGINRYGFNPTDVAAFGCTSEGQARRLGKWILDTELNTSEAVVFNVALDNADLTAGDIVKIMDQDYVGLQLAGRIAGGSTTVIDLDRDVILNGGEVYTLVVLDADGQAVSERTITTGAGTVSQITVSPALLDTGVALKNNPYLIESDTGIKPRQFRVLFMREQEKGKFEISASQYDPNKYARVETGIVLPADVYSTFDGAASVAEITAPTFEVQAYTDPTFGAAVKLVVKWTHPDVYTGTFKVQWREANGYFTEPRYIEEKEFEILNITPNTYEVMISAISVRGVSSVPYIEEFTFAPNVTNTMNPPINLVITPDIQDGSNTTFAGPDCSFQWENNPANDDVGGTGVFGGIAGYRIIIKDGSDVELDVREMTNVTSNDPYFVQTFNFADNAASLSGPHRTLKVDVYTRTVDGAVSASPISKTFTNPFPPAPGLGLQDNPTGSFATVTPTGNNKDTAGSVICIRDTAGDFTPLVGDIVYQGTDLAMQIPFGAPLEARSVKAAVFDNFSFSFSDLVFSTVERQEPSPYGISSVTTLPTLPTALYPDGVVVYLTTDKKLYRVTLNGTVWSTAVDGEDIEANSILSNSLVTGTVQAAKMETGTITAASGILADAVIETAKIADLNVSTLKIENGAVTNIGQHEVGSIYSKTPFAGTSNGNPPLYTNPVTWVNIASVPLTIDSSASDISIIINADVVVESGYPTGGVTRGSEYCGVRIRRDGTMIWQGLFDIGRNHSGWKKDFAQSRSGASTIDGGISGAHTYYLDIFGQTQGSNINTEYYYYQNSIIVTEVKR